MGPVAFSHGSERRVRDAAFTRERSHPFVGGGDLADTFEVDLHKSTQYDLSYLLQEKVRRLVLFTSPTTGQPEGMSNRVERRREAFRAWVMKHGGIPAVAAKSGAPKTTLYSYLNHKKTDDLSAASVEKITTAYDVPTDDLFGASRKTVPLVGYVGAGAEAHFYDVGQDPFDEVDAPSSATADTVAVRIRGQSMGAWYDNWTVYYDEVRSPVTPDLIGEVCVVGLEDGRVLVKQLQASRNEGYFHLISLTEPPITDAVVAWAAKVREMRPNG